MKSENTYLFGGYNTLSCIADFSNKKAILI